MHWLSMLVQNREVDDIENLGALEFLKKNFNINANGYDLIIGYRADDSYFTFARDFINDGITLQTLYQAMTSSKKQKKDKTLGWSETDQNKGGHGAIGD